MASTEPSTVDAIVALASEDQTPRACEAVEAWAKAGRWDDLLALAAALEERSPTADPARGRFETVADHVEDQIAIGAGDAAVDALLVLALRERKRSVVVPRTPSMRMSAFASRLGYGHPPATFIAALDRTKPEGPQDELFACWMHELILRGHSLAKEPSAARFQEGLAAGKHPLARLPLELQLTEREAPTYMPLYGGGGLGRAIDALTSGSMSVRTIPPPAGGAAVESTLLEADAAVDTMRVAVGPWAEGKRGRIEAKVFALRPAVDGTSLGSWLVRALPLESTAGISRLDCSRTGAEGAFGPLFAAASNGGAYSPGLGGAYGRLAAWTSLGALVGAPAGSDPAAIDALAGACGFLTFRAPGPWFHDVAWDLGLLVLRPEGATVAILAATDTE